MRTNGTPNGPAACASSHRQRRKWWTALAVLAVLVVLGTVAALTMPASTMSVADMATPETAAAAENGQAADAPAQDPNATAPAENTPDETAPAATPAPATPESAAPAAAEYTAALGEGADALNVVVTAPAGAFDEGVEPVLQVTALESEQDLQAIAAELDGHEVAYDGFAALDITFTDAQGQEIEPKLPVKVRMELPQAVVDSGIDLTTLTVQHLAEDDQGNVTSMDQVASVAGNTITLSDAAAAAVNEAAGIATMSNNALTAESAEAPVVAEFEVDGFSSFVITWGNYHNTITFEFVNQDGSAIDVSNSGQYNDRINLGEEFAVPDDVPQLEGYTFDHAEYGGYYWDSWYSQTQIEESIKIDSTWTGGTSVWVDGDRQYSSDRTVRLYYIEDQGGDNPGGGDSGSTGANVTVGKSAVLDEDTGNYTLELSVTGDRGSVSNKQKLDVLFVMDVSGSMDNQFGYSGDRLDAAKDAIYEISGYGNRVGLSDNDALNVRYALVTFSGSKNNDYNSSDKYNDASNRTNGWVDVDVLGQTVARVQSEDGTNYEAGLRVANNEIPASDSDAIRVVIFISDGNPGYYYDKDGYTEGTGNPGGNYNGTALSQAVLECKKLDTDYFYFVGITWDLNSTVINDMVTAVDVPSTNKGSFGSNDTEELLDAFDEIEQQLTFFAADNVVMTDPLSQWADIVTNQAEKVEFTVKLEKRNEDGEYVQVDGAQTVTSGNAATFTTTATDEDGKDKQTTFKMTPTWTPATAGSATSTGTIKVTFDSNYELAPDYRYVVSTTIKPSDKAVEETMSSPDADNDPDNGTGTHADDGLLGFWSNDNDNAKVTYKVENEDGEKLFPRPVIRVQEETTADLTIVKNIYGLSQDQVVDLVNGKYQTQCDKGDHTHGLRFDVDYFGNEEDAKNDNWDNESDPTSTFIDDWTFDVKQTLDANDEFVSNASDTEWSGDIQEPVDLDTPDDKEGDSYMSSSLTYVANTGEEPYYRYTITIKDAKLEDWYHVWETNTEVTGYDLEASVKAVNADGEDIENIAENTHDNKATAFQLTGDTTVTFTNRYTHSPVTVNFKKVDATYHEQGLAGAQFKLFYTENNTNHYYTENGTSGANWDATEDTATSIASENDGTLTLPALEVGRTYYLTEVTAPDGYQLLTQNIKIVVNENGDIKVTYADGSTLPENTENKDINLIPNTTGTELPETGGRGTNFLTIGGLLIMAAAAGGYVLRRRRGKEAR